MISIEFQTTVHDGIIEIPAEYRERVSGRVTVRMESAAPPHTTPNLIDELISNPLHVPGFRPLSREEAHER